MSWQEVFEAALVCMSGLGVWFLGDLVQDFKKFKEGAGQDIQDLKTERVSFITTVKEAKLDLATQVIEAEKTHNDFHLVIKDCLSDLSKNMERIKVTSDETARKVSTLEDFISRVVTLCKKLESRVEKHDDQLASLRSARGE